MARGRGRPVLHRRAAGTTPQAQSRCRGRDPRRLDYPPAHPAARRHHGQSRCAALAARGEVGLCARGEPGAQRPPGGLRRPDQEPLLRHRRVDTAQPPLRQPVRCCLPGQRHPGRGLARPRTWASRMASLSASPRSAATIARLPRCSSRPRCSRSPSCSTSTTLRRGAPAGRTCSIGRKNETLRQARGRSSRLRAANLLRPSAQDDTPLVSRSAQGDKRRLELRGGCQVLLRPPAVPQGPARLHHLPDQRRRADESHPAPAPDARGREGHRASGSSDQAPGSHLAHPEQRARP